MPSDLTPFWYAAASSAELTRQLLPRMVLGEQLVLFRTETGEAVARETRRRLDVEGLLGPAGLIDAITPRVGLLASGSAADLQSAVARLLCISAPAAQLDC